MAIFWQTLLKRMRHADIETVACVPPGDPEAEAQISHCGTRLVHYSLDRKGLNPLRDLQTLRQLKAIIAAEKPNIVFSSTIKPVIYASLAAKSLHIPAIFATITGLGYVFEKDTFRKKLIHKIGSALYHLALKNLDGVYFQNKDDAALFTEECILTPGQKVLFAPGVGVDTSVFRPASFPVGGPTFLLSGRLLEAKGIEDYAEAARILKQKWPEARFQLLGIPEKGRGSFPLERVRKLQNAGVLEYLGQTRDVRPYLAGCHVAVLPSWREGTPTALLEAMAMGRPCVATAVPGCREVVKPGVNGWLCEVRNPRSLAEAMEKFLIEPSSINVMGAESRKLAETKFDATVVADNIIAEITGILKEKGKR